MSDVVGQVNHGKESSSEQRAIIDQEVKKLLDASYERAKKLITAHRKELDLIARALIEHETLTGIEVQDALAGHLKKSAKPPLLVK